MDNSMIIREKILRELIPSENMRLTNGETIAEDNVVLAVSDSPDNWYEITEEEAERRLAERNEADESLFVNR